MAGLAGGERHLQHGRRRQHRIASQPMIGQPRLQHQVDMAGPFAPLGAAAAAEQDMVNRLLGQDGSLMAARHGGGAAAQGRAWQALTLAGALEMRRIPRVGPQRRGTVDHGGQWVTRRVALGEAVGIGRLTAHRAQAVAQIA